MAVLWKKGEKAGNQYFDNKSCTALCFTAQSQLFYQLKQNAFQNNVEKGANTGNQQSHFPVRHYALPHNPNFFINWNRMLFKTMWKKEKTLVISNLTFTYNVFNPFKYLFSVELRFLCCRNKKYLVGTLGATFFGQLSGKLVRIFVLMKSWMSFNLGTHGQ